LAILPFFDLDEKNIFASKFWQNFYNTYNIL
jgi:hypothetical protein